MKTLHSFAASLIITLLLLTASAALNSAQAQSGFSAGSYYNQSYAIQDVPVGYSYARYDFYGNYIGTYQMWQAARWYNNSGGHFVNVWGHYGWQSQWVSGYYYWFDWITYERRVG